MDVTEEILRNHLIYGASDNTAPHTIAASKSLNYAQGGSIQRPIQERVTVIPRTINYKDTVGLFGVENCFIRVNVDVPLDITLQCYEEPFWECAHISLEEAGYTNYYESAIIDYNKDFEMVNDYEPANITSKVRASTDSFISVDLDNLKTNNIYVDDWLDVRLYTSERMEHPYDKMYVRLHDYFYIGFHARNTRRLPYNVNCLIGKELVPSSSVEDTRYIARIINR
jgi:hypothetical protein